MNDNLHKAPTQNTPEIDFNTETNRYIIKGKSIPEDANQFYTPYKDWLEKHFDKNVDESQFIFDLEYFNSSSTKIIFDILIILRESIKNGNEIKVIWKYDEDDEELYNSGNELEEFIGIPITLECKKTEDN
ncbi:MAG: hypothetical protein C0599_16215 [Salinivirgaceae bacterium]|nr:MAG: hypothetical protein C0599_16215 [Salinivirgaceae bacterium]